MTKGNEIREEFGNKFTAKVIFKSDYKYDRYLHSYNIIMVKNNFLKTKENKLLSIDDISEIIKI